MQQHRENNVNNVNISHITASSTFHHLNWLNRDVVRCSSRYVSEYRKHLFITVCFITYIRNISYPFCKSYRERWTRWKLTYGAKFNCKFASLIPFASFVGQGFAGKLVKEECRGPGVGATKPRWRPAAVDSGRGG